MKRKLGQDVNLYFTFRRAGKLFYPKRDSQPYTFMKVVHSDLRDELNASDLQRRLGFAGNEIGDQYSR